MKIYQMYRISKGLVLAFLFCLVMMLPLLAEAKIVTEDTEKPKPQFTRNDDIVTAKLIPRGRSTSVVIDFAVSGGKLQSVEDMDFEAAETPQVDKKDFRSGLFVAKIGGIAPGAEVEVSMACDYFTGSTEFWVYNPKSSEVWTNVKGENEDLPNRVNKVSVKVKDGGPLDADGSANGEILLTFGPKDSFWGYAIGTLFIRFWGVFMVLAMLQIGMILSSKIFTTIERRAAREKTDLEALLTNAAAPEKAAQPLTDRSIAAAIAMALHLHFSHELPGKRMDLSFSKISAWSHQGRTHLMRSRFSVFDRGKRY